MMDVSIPGSFHNAQTVEGCTRLHSPITLMGRASPCTAAFPVFTYPQATPLDTKLQAPLHYPTPSRNSRPAPPPAINNCSMRFHSHSKHSQALSALPSPPTRNETSLLPHLLQSFHALAGPLTPAETARLTPQQTLLRYLRARSHSVPDAASMLHESLLFHRNSPSPPVCPTCVRNPSSHSFFPLGPLDIPQARVESHLDANPVMYSNFHVTDRNPAHVVVHMRVAMEATFHPDSIHRMVWVMDFAGFTRADMSPGSAKRVLSLFADHYPERLGCAVIYDAPRAFSALWAAVKLFAAPETVAKVFFINHGETRQQAFQQIGIEGKVYKRVCQEIDMARREGATGTWWARSPLPPLVDYGKDILNAAESTNC